MAKTEGMLPRDWRSEYRQLPVGTEVNIVKHRIQQYGMCDSTIGKVTSDRALVATVKCGYNTQKVWVF